MKIAQSRAVRIALAVVLVTSTCALAQMRRRAESNTDEQEWLASNATVSSVVLQLERLSDRDLRLIDTRMVAAVAESTALIDTALVKAFGKPAEGLRPLVKVDAEPANDSYLTLTVSVKKSDASLGTNPSDAALAEMCRQISAAVELSANTQFESLRARRAKLVSRIDEARSRLKSLNEDYNRAATQMENNSFERNSKRSELERQRSQLAGTIASHRAQIAQAEKNHADLGAASTPRPDKLLSRVVEIRQAQLDRVAARFAAGQTSQEEVENAELALVEAQINLAGQVETNIATGGLGVSNLRAILAGQEAQLAVVDNQLKELPSPSTAPSIAPQISMQQMNELSNERQMAKSHVQSLEAELTQLDQQYGDMRAPRVIPLTVQPK